MSSGKTFFERDSEHHSASDKITSKDAPELREPKAKDKYEAELSRTNASDGSLRERNFANVYQDNSIEIVGLSGIASRRSKLTEKELLSASKSITPAELLTKVDNMARSLLEGFGEAVALPMGQERDKAIARVQNLADSAYGRGKYAFADLPTCGGDQVSKVAQNIDYDGRMPTLLPNSSTLELGSQAYKYGFEHPFRGREMQRVNAISPEAWKDSYNDFPELKTTGKLDEHTASKLMKALVANELEHYDPVDLTEDILAKTVPDKLAKYTIGYSQISADGVKQESQDLERQLKRHERTSNPLKDFVSAPMADVVKALENPQNMPLFVAANLAHNVRMYSKHNYPITLKTLAYGFNPDLCRTDDRKEHDIFPRDLSESAHVKNVEKWLNQF